jgi:hypothetical protein
MQLKWKEVRQIAEKLGVQLRPGKDLVGWVEHEGIKILPVRMSKGEGDVPGKVPDKIRQQYRLNEAQFKLLKECPLNKQGYLDILRQKGVL